MRAFARCADTGADARTADAILRHAVDAYQKDPSHILLDTILLSPKRASRLGSNSVGSETIPGSFAATWLPHHQVNSHRLLFRMQAIGYHLNEHLN